MSQLIKSAPYRSENIRFNKDELNLIDNRISIPANSIYTAIDDLKGNGKDWISDAIEKSFEKIRDKNCLIHQEELKKHERKLKVHDWWLWALSATIGAIILILIFA